MGPLLPLLLLLPNANRRLTDSADKSLSRGPVPLPSPNVSLFPNASLFLIALQCPDVLLFQSVCLCPSVLLCQGLPASPPPGRSLTPSATPSPSPPATLSPELSPRPTALLSPSPSAGPSLSRSLCPHRWKNAPPPLDRSASQTTRRLLVKTALLSRQSKPTLTVTLPVSSAPWLSSPRLTLTSSMDTARAPTMPMASASPSAAVITKSEPHPSVPEQLPVTTIVLSYSLQYW